MGPEAALLALCGATTSWWARKVFGFTGHRLRNMTLLGMTAGLAAFFGVALGGGYQPSLRVAISTGVPAAGHVLLVVPAMHRLF